MVFFGGTIVFITTRPEFKTETLQTVTSDSRDQTGYQEALPGVQVVSDDGLKMELRDSDWFNSYMCEHEELSKEIKKKLNTAWKWALNAEKVLYNYWHFHATIGHDCFRIVGLIT